jgi:hypothetical protein
VVLKNSVTVIESFYFISGGMNTLVQCVSVEPGINTVLSNEKGLQWNINSTSHDKHVEEKCKAKGILNVIIVGLDPIGHKELPKVGITLYIEPFDN